MYIIVYKIRAYSCSLNYVVAAFFKDVQFLGFFSVFTLKSKSKFCSKGSGLYLT